MRVLVTLCVLLSGFTVQAKNSPDIIIGIIESVEDLASLKCGHTTGQDHHVYSVQCTQAGTGKTVSFSIDLRSGSSATNGVALVAPLELGLPVSADILLLFTRRLAEAGFTHLRSGSPDLKWNGEIENRNYLFPEGSGHSAVFEDKDDTSMVFVETSVKDGVLQFFIGYFG